LRASRWPTATDEPASLPDDLFLLAASADDSSGLRRARWLTEEADASLLKISVNFFIPCLIFENVLNNAALREPSNLLFTPLAGFTLMSACLLLGLFFGRLLRLKKARDCARSRTPSV